MENIINMNNNQDHGVVESSSSVVGTGTTGRASTTASSGSLLFQASRRIKTPRVGGRERRRLLREQRVTCKNKNVTTTCTPALTTNRTNDNDASVVDTRGDVSEGGSGGSVFGGGFSLDGSSTTDREGVDGPHDNKTREVSASTSTSTAVTTQTLTPRGKSQAKVVFNEFSEKPLEVLHLEISDDIPEPADESHVVVKVTASTVSIQDCMLRKGVTFHSSHGDLPLTPGMDIVGTIVSCGTKVRSVYVGDRVAALVRVGGNARYISVPETSLVEVPRSLDPAEAVCMVSTYLTAYQTIRKVTNDSFSLEGKRVLITGTMEPVGQALVQLCLRAGALEIYATAPKLRHRYVKSVLGANPLPPEPEEWLPLIKGKVNVVFDGECQDDLSSPYSALRDNGILVCLGMTALLGRESAGILGAPFAAYWARFKGQLLPNAIVYDVWDNFVQDPNSFKVNLVCLRSVSRRYRQSFKMIISSTWFAYHTSSLIWRFCFICSRKSSSNLTSRSGFHWSL
jgi:NADPH:quinone reductase-like Zn-dependent oxidoreductase